MLPGDTSDEGRAVATRIESRRRALMLHRGPVAALHTDYQLQNLADSEGRIHAYDPVGHRVGHVYFDVTRFLIGAELHRRIDTATRRAWPDDAETDRAAFLEAYGGVRRPWLGQFRLVEDLQLARLWRNFRSRGDLDAAGALRLRIIEEMMHRRGLVGTPPPR